MGTSIICDLLELCGEYTVFMILWNVWHTQSARGPHKNCPQSPRARVWPRWVRLLWVL